VIGGLVPENFGRMVERRDDMMTKAMLMKWLLLPVIALCCITRFAMACEPGPTLDLRDILAADLVVVAALQDHRIVETQRNDRPWQYAELDLYVLSYLKGQRPAYHHGDNALRMRQITVRFETWTGRVVATFGKDRLVLGLDFKPEWQQPERLVGQTTRDKQGQYLQVLGSETCLEPFLFDIASDAGRAIQQIFDGKGDAAAKADTLAKFIGLDGQLD
jgi:hypothetical protein